MKLKFYTLRIICWFVLFMLAGHQIGAWLDYSFQGLLIALAFACVTVVLSFPDLLIKEKNKNE